MKTGIVPENGMVITTDTQFAPGVYVLPDGIQIAADNITISGQNTMLVSPVQKGAGIHAAGHSNLTIRDLSISGYYYGIRLDHCPNPTIERVTIRNTHEIEGIGTFLRLWLPLEEAYGGAILLHDVTGGTVRECDLQHQMNGVLLYLCNGVTVDQINASFNSGWSVYLSQTMESTIQDNQLDFCNRVFKVGDGASRAEADAAGIVLVKSASRNKILRNSCLAGGDGIFVAGYEHPGMIDPCNDNLFEENDCRLSPNNAIESTFSQGNVFRKNNCSRSNYGLWLGYSWENTLEDNLVELNRFSGIALEHGFDFMMQNNQIRHNGEGVRLFTRGVLEYWRGHEVTYNVTLENNHITGNRSGILAYTGDETTDEECHHFHLKHNTFHDNRVGAYFRRVQNCQVEDNIFRKNVEAGLRLVDNPGVTIGENEFEDNDIDVERL